MASGGQPSRDMIEAAEDLAPIVRASIEQTERERRLPAALVSTIAEAGLFRMLVPRELGGAEVDPCTMIRAIEAVARVDGSTGWCVMIGATSGVTAAYLPDQAARQIYGDPLGITGGALAPTGAATPIEGGVRVNGRWGFGSGVEHCAWRIANCIVIEDGSPRIGAGGHPELRSVIVPTADTEVIDTWTVSGLRGTGSHDFAITDRFVPSERTFALGGHPKHGAPLYQFPVFGLLALGVAATATGMARGAIDALLELAAVKTPTGSRRHLRERGHTQMQVARAEAMLRAARASMLAAAGEVWSVVHAGDTITTAHRASLRLAATHAAITAAEAVDLMYNAGGASSIYASSPLQRYFRDVHTATQHVMVAPSVYETAGRLLLGLESDSALF